jgi:hypothetical protein
MDYSVQRAEEDSELLHKYAKYIAKHKGLTVVDAKKYIIEQLGEQYAVWVARDHSERAPFASFFIGYVPVEEEKRYLEQQLGHRIGAKNDNQLRVEAEAAERARVNAAVRALAAELAPAAPAQAEAAPAQAEAAPPKGGYRKRKTRAKHSKKFKKTRRTRR